MAQLRTQIYLEPAQHAALIQEARRFGLSLAGMIRRLVDDHFQMGRGGSSDARKKAALSLIGLGRSGRDDVSERTDDYVGQAIHEELLRERRRPYKSRRK